MLGRFIIVLLSIHSVWGYSGHHHHDKVASKAAKAHAALIHAVHRTARLVNGTEAEMLRCAHALASGQAGLKEARDRMNKLQNGLKANAASINETAKMEAILTTHLANVETKLSKQSSQAESLEKSVGDFARRIQEDSEELADAKQSLFDRIANIRLKQDELRHEDKELDVTKLALKRMHSWKNIDQQRVKWEQEKLEEEERNHKRLHQSLVIETGEVRKELLAIERKVMTWDAKRFLLADLLASVESSKKQIAKKKYAANEDKARLQDLSHLLQRRAHERVEQQEKLKHAQEEYHDTLEKVVQAQEAELSEDKERIKQLRSSESAKAKALKDARLKHDKLKAERDNAHLVAADYESELVDSERRSAEMVSRRDEMLEKLTKQREKALAAKDEEISKLVDRLNKVAASRDAEAAEVVKLQGSLDALRPAYESRGDAVKMYEDIMKEQNHDLKSVKSAHEKLRDAYHSTEADLEKCLFSENQVDSIEAKEVLEAVEAGLEGTMAGALGEVGEHSGNPLQEIVGAMKEAMTQALGPQYGNPGAAVPVVEQGTTQEKSAVDKTQQTLQNLKESLSVGAAAAGATSTQSSEENNNVPSHFDSEPEALTTDFERLLSKLGNSAAGKPVNKDTLAASWEHAASARKIHERSVELPNDLAGKVRTLAAELHDVHFGMAGLAGAIDVISKL